MSNTTPAKNSIENFNGNLLSLSKWANWGLGQIIQKDGQLRMSSITAGGYFGMDCLDYVDLTGSEASVEIIDVGNQALASLEMYPIQMLLDANNSVLFLITNGDIYAYHKVAGVGAGLVNITFDPVAHRYVRIRESAGSIFWDTSPDRSRWTNLWTETNPFAVTNLFFEPTVGTWQAEATASTVIIDNINYLANSQPHNMARGFKAPSGISIAK